MTNPGSVVSEAPSGLARIQAPVRGRLDRVLEDHRYQVYFDALVTGLRVENVKKAVAAGKHVYCEKPMTLNCEQLLTR